VTQKCTAKTSSATETKILTSNARCEEPITNGSRKWNGRTKVAHL
jgi:hypothetical protein